MKTALTIVQILLAISLTTLIFLQSSNESDSRGNILSSTSVEKRGWEKIIFYITVTVLVTFIVSSIVQTLL